MAVSDPLEEKSPTTGEEGSEAPGFDTPPGPCAKCRRDRLIATAAGVTAGLLMGGAAVYLITYARSHAEG